MQLEFSVSPRAFRRVQYALVVILLVLGLGRYLYPHIPNHALIFSVLVVFDVGVENSIPTYFAVLNLLLAALLLWVIYQAGRVEGERTARHWAALAGVLFFLSLDEGVAIHEHFETLAERLADRGIPLLSSSWAWIPFGAALALGVGVAFLPFLRALPRRLVIRFVLAGALYLTGALVMEYLGGVMLTRGITSEGGILYQMEELVEEGLELFAIAFFNNVLYAEIARRGIRLSLRAG